MRSRARIAGSTLERVRLASPFLLRTVEPPLGDVDGRVVASVERLGKRIVFASRRRLFLVVHLMIAGRLRWRRAAPPSRRARSASPLSTSPTGTLVLTEAGTQAARVAAPGRAASAALASSIRGGLEVARRRLDEFATRLTRENHTLKRALTDPRLFSGIGNAYSDEILHARGCRRSS